MIKITFVVVALSLLRIPASANTPEATIRGERIFSAALPGILETAAGCILRNQIASKMPMPQILIHNSLLPGGQFGRLAGVEYASMDHPGNRIDISAPMLGLPPTIIDDMNRDPSVERSVGITFEPIIVRLLKHWVDFDVTGGGDTLEGTLAAMDFAALHSVERMKVHQQWLAMLDQQNSATHRHLEDIRMLTHNPAGIAQAAARLYPAPRSIHDINSNAEVVRLTQEKEQLPSTPQNIAKLRSLDNLLIFWSSKERVENARNYFKQNEAAMISWWNFWRLDHPHFELPRVPELSQLD